MRLEPRRHASRLSVLATVVLVASAAVTGGSAQAATTALRGVPATHAITRALPADAQKAARSFWTKARMESATPLTRSLPKNGQASTTARSRSIPNPTLFNGVPTVGVLFFTIGSLHVLHFCSASVVDSSTSDLVLTAAHCVYNTVPVTTMAYVPEWHQGVSPYGTWPVETVTVAAGWEQSQNPNLDFAFLKVAPPSGTSKPIQAVTGGLHLGINTGYDHSVYVIGYNWFGDQANGCATTSSEFEANQMQFACNNYQDGTSGGPWIINYDPATGGGTVIGNIGGYEQGGASPWSISYSVYYSSSIQQLFTQAEHQKA
jgi:V8-like Glu-specific endopeptidase